MSVLYLVAAGLLSSTVASDITFPPVSGLANQQVLGHRGEGNVTTGPAFSGESFAPAILGAPFDAVSEAFSVQVMVHVCRMRLLVLVKDQAGRRAPSLHRATAAYNTHAGWVLQLRFVTLSKCFYIRGVLCVHLVIL